ncbi:MAG: hypothetical protein PVJ27_02100 [Candidatus Brocadiaceae bacterium]|jgi:hypothetical protein
MKRITQALFAVMFISAVGVHAEPAPHGRAREVAPFIDSQMAGLLHVDVSRLDVSAALEQLRQMGGGVAKALQAADVSLQSEAARFRESGGKHLYVVFTSAGPLHYPCIAAVPLGEEGDGQAILGQMRSLFGEAERLDGFVLAGHPAQIERVRSMAPDPRPELEEAFAAAAGNPVQLFLLPTADHRRVIEETLPLLPEELGGGPSTVLTRGVLWGAAGFSSEPSLSGKVVVQSADSTAAGRLLAHLTDVKKLLRKMTEAEAEGGRDYDRLAELLTPVASGNRLVLSLDPPRVQAVTDCLSRPVQRMRDRARLKESRHNMHNILLGCLTYRRDHDGQWPDALRDLVEGGYLEKRRLRNPLRPEGHDGYVYRKPPRDAGGGTAVVHDRYDGWPEVGVNVGFVDAAVMTVESEERLQQILEEGR